MRLVILGLFLSVLAKGQIDSAMAVPLVGIHLGGQLPFSDMADRFGPNLEAGGSFMYKTRKNWLIGAEFNYGFGRNVKENVLTQLTNPDGFVVDNEGYPADIRVTERMMGIHVSFGKIFKVLNPNPNSGIMVSVGVGYLQHKINLYDAQRKLAAIKGDLAYGLDRLSSGLSLSQFVGYMFLSENRMANFYFGFDCYQGFTTSVRKVNYDTGLPDTRKRLDVLTGFRVGWILPLYKKKPAEYYYN
jgi:hypothetical protein